MNIDDIELLDTSTLHLRHPVSDAPLYTSDGQPMTIELSGENAKEYKATTRRWQNETLRRPNRKLTAEQLEERGLELLVVSTRNWNLEGRDGPIPFSPRVAHEIYSDPSKSWIRKQVEAHVYDDANFMGELLTA